MVAQKSPQVEKAVARLMELSNDEQTRLMYERRQMMEWDIKTREHQARDEGRSEGRNEGLREGRNEGRSEGLREVARKLKKAGIMSPEQIAQYTGCSVDEIEQL